MLSEYQTLDDKDEFNPVESYYLKNYFKTPEYPYDYMPIRGRCEDLPSPSNKLIAQTNQSTSANTTGDAPSTS